MGKLKIEIKKVGQKTIQSRKLLIASFPEDCIETIC